MPLFDWWRNGLSDSALSRLPGMFLCSQGVIKAQRTDSRKIMFHCDGASNHCASSLFSRKYEFLVCPFGSVEPPSRTCKANPHVQSENPLRKDRYIRQILRRTCEETVLHRPPFANAGLPHGGLQLIGLRGGRMLVASPRHEVRCSRGRRGRSPRPRRASHLVPGRCNQHPPSPRADY